MSLKDFQLAPRPTMNDSSLEDLNSTIYAMLLAHHLFGSAGMAQRMWFSDEILEIKVMPRLVPEPNTSTFQDAKRFFLKGLHELERKGARCTNPERLHWFVRVVEDAEVPFDATEFSEGFTKDIAGSE